MSILWEFADFFPTWSVNKFLSQKTNYIFTTKICCYFIWNNVNKWLLCSYIVLICRPNLSCAFKIQSLLTWIEFRTGDIHNYIKVLHENAYHRIGHTVIVSNAEERHLITYNCSMAVVEGLKQSWNTIKLNFKFRGIVYV